MQFYYHFNKPLTLSILPSARGSRFWGSFQQIPFGGQEGMKMAKKVNTAPKLTIAAGTQTVFFSQGMHYNKR